jgi:hypothetical protein
MCCSQTRDFELSRGKAAAELLRAHNQTQRIESAAPLRTAAAHDVRSALVPGRKFRAAVTLVRCASQRLARLHHGALWTAGSLGGSRLDRAE